MISIVIRTFNEQKHLPELLRMIKSQETGLGYEIIVVDSGSSDHTLKIASEYNCKIVKINKEEFSFGRSLNSGCALAKGEFIVIVSAHCIPVNTNWLNKLVEPLTKDSNVALSYGKQIGNEITKFSEHQVFSKYYPDQDKNPQEDYFCNNANACIRKRLWEAQKYD